MKDAARPITIDLPFPPSVNEIWRTRRSREPGKKTQYYRSPVYQAWLAESDATLMAMRPRPKKVVGHFTVRITLDQTRRRGDADNRNKGVLDWLQRAGLIENDSKADDVSIGWGEAPIGCRVTITPVTPVYAARELEAS
jgi:Holliday junction resolvase RusA-like endonuclease